MLIFDMFLEKTVLKDVSSNDADWIRDLRIVLIAAQKNYALDAPLGDRQMQEQMQTLWTFGKFDMMTTW